jgi:hypothetical protein
MQNDSSLKHDRPDQQGPSLRRSLLVVLLLFVHSFGSFIPLRFMMMEFVHPNLLILHASYDHGARQFSIPDVLSNILFSFFRVCGWKFSWRGQ